MPEGVVAVGVGLSSRAGPDELRHLVEEVLAGAGVAHDTATVVATTARLASDRRVLSLGRPVLAYSPAQLAGVAGVTTASPRAAAAVGTPSVAEAAALLAVGDGGRLVVTRRSSAFATAAVAVSGGAEGAGR